MRQLTPAAVEAKRSRERRVVLQMITAYCHGNHGTGGGVLCPECTELAEYAERRVAHCPKMSTKTFCSRCETHCYSPVMRDRIRKVMRYSGPRMLFSHPLMATRHGVDTLAAKLEARGTRRDMSS